MVEIPIGLAFTAGMLAVVNPCGFALLPAYASMLVLGDETSRRTVAVGRALTFAAAMTAGFAVVFGVFGLLLASVAGVVQERLPWFTVVLGVVLAAAGAWSLAGRALPGVRIGTRRGPALTRSGPTMAAFGVVFAAYALGLGLVVGAVSLAVALARTSVVTRLRRTGRLAGRLGGLLLVVAGLYVGYYGWYELRVLRGGAVDDPVIAAGAAVQRWLAGGLDRAGAAGVAVVFTLLLAVPLVRRVRRRAAPPGQGPPQ